MKALNLNLIRICTTLAVSLLAIFTVSAQEVIEVKTTQALMSKGTQPCYLVFIPQADMKTVQQNWIKKIQENNKVKIKEVGQELVFIAGVKAEFMPDTINLYTLLIQAENGINMNMFLETDSIFFSPKEDKSDLASDKIDNGIKFYLRTFAVDQYRLAVENELAAEEKNLETLEDELKKLEKDEENMKKEISGLENDIDQKEREISDLDKNIEVKQQALLTHNTSMLSLATDVEKDAAKNKQKELEKEKKQLEKERSKAKDDISSYKSDIEKNEKAIEDGTSLQAAKQEEITARNEVIRLVSEKLAGIK